MAGTPKTIAGPAFLSNAIANIFTPNAALKYQITHISVTNNTAGAVTFSLFVDTTGAGTAGKELVKDYSLAAKGTAGATWDRYNGPTLDGSNAAHFLTGLASALSSLIITVEGYVSAL
jgi:hypothetical protein